MTRRRARPCRPRALLAAAAVPLALVLALGLAAAPAQATAPAPAEPSAERGKRLYTSYCARCHGVNMVNTAGTTFDLRRFPKDQRERFELSVVKGKNAMPAWGDTLKPDELQSLWLYVSGGGG